MTRRSTPSWPRSRAPTRGAADRGPRAAREVRRREPAGHPGRRPRRNGSSTTRRTSSAGLPSRIPTTLGSRRAPTTARAPAPTKWSCCTSARGPDQPQHRRPPSDLPPVRGRAPTPRYRSPYARRLICDASDPPPSFRNATPRPARATLARTDRRRGRVHPGSRHVGFRRHGPSARCGPGGARRGPGTHRACHAAWPTRLRAQRIRAAPEHAAEPDPGHRRLDRQPAGRQSVRHAALCAAVRAGHLRVSGRPAHLPGRLLHRCRRPGCLARRRRDQRRCRRLQPVLVRQLYRAG